MIQPNGWSCYPTAVCCLTGLNYDRLIARIGHDGSDVVSTWLSDPWNRQTFCYGEMALALLHFKWALIPLPGAIECCGNLLTTYPTMAKLTKILQNQKVVVVAAKSDGEHAYAYENGQLYDPSTGNFVKDCTVPYPIKYFEVLKRIDY